MKGIVLNEAWWALVLVLTACDTGTSDQGDTGFTVRDSAGVEIVENGALPVTLGLVVDESRRQILSPGGDLHRVTGVRIQASGTLVLANAGLYQLIFIDPATEQVVTSGRKGQGPGEFEWMSGLFLCAGDSVVVVELNRGIVHLLDPEGRFVRQTHALPDGIGRPWDIPVVAEDCNSLVVLKQERIPPAGQIGSMPFTVAWYDVGVGQLDSVSTVPGLETFRLPDLGHVTMPFGNKPSFATQGSRVHIGTGKAPEIRTHDRRGNLVRLLRWLAEPEPISEGDRARYHATRDRLIEQDGLDFWSGFRPMDEYTVRVKPLFPRMFVDGDGRLWVQKYPGNWSEWVSRYGLPPDAEPAVWWIFAPSGQLLGLGTTPAGLVVNDVRDGMLVGVARDEDDVEQIHLYPLTERFRSLSPSPE